MASKRGKLAALAALAIGIAALAGSGIAFRRSIVESWHIHRLGSEDPAIRERAAARLAEMGSARAVPRLIEIFIAENRTPDASHYCADTLIRIGEPAFRAILRDPRTGDLFPILRRAGSAAIPSMAEALSSGTWEARLFAVQAIRDLGAEPAAVLPILLRATEDEDRTIRLISFAGISRMGEKAESAIPVLIRKLEDPQALGEVREASAMTLAIIGPKAMPELIGRLDSRDRTVRSICVETLGHPEMRSDEIIDRIRKALADEEPIVRRSAARALARIGTPAREAIPDLRRALRDPELMEDAIDALLWIEPREAFLALLEDLETKDWKLLGKAEKIIRLTGLDVREAALPGLLDALGAADAAVRRDACRAIGAIFPPPRSAVPALAERSRTDPDEDVRREALVALEKIEEP